MSLPPSMATGDELDVAVAGHYALGNRSERGRILDKFAVLPGHQREHTMRLLRAFMARKTSGPRPGRRLYGEATRQPPIVIWKVPDRIFLWALDPLVSTLIEAMERNGHLDLASEVRIRLLWVTAITSDRTLREARGPTGPRQLRTLPSAAIRRDVSARTCDDWDNLAPGCMEADLVAHGGPIAKGSLVPRLTLTNIATNWTECTPVPMR